MRKITAALAGALAGAGILVAIGAASPTAARLIGSAQIRDGSVGMRDLAPAVRAKINSRPAQVTVTGGDPTPTAAWDLAKFVQVDSASNVMNASLERSQITAEVLCPPGAVAVAGWHNVIGNGEVTSSYPRAGRSGWLVNARYTGPLNLQALVSVSATCALP